MPNQQLHPLEINPETGEPFLRLKHHRNIILTPPRWEDARASVAYMNDLRVNEWLASVSYPYSLEQSEMFLKSIKNASDEVLKLLEDARDEPEPILVGSCPVRSIREVKSDGTDVYIGDVGLMRCMHGELMGLHGVNWENKDKLEAENDSLPIGNPSIIWSIGDFLAPSHHGQGIMTDAVGTVLHAWAIPRMGVRHMWVSAFTGNEGSVKVFLKNGFQLIVTHEDHVEVKGKRRGLHLLEWKYQP